MAFRHSLTISPPRRIASSGGTSGPRPFRRLRIATARRMCNVQALGLRGKETASSSSSGIFFQRSIDQLVAPPSPGELREVGIAEPGSDVIAIRHDGAVVGDLGAIEVRRLPPHGVFGHGHGGLGPPVRHDRPEEETQRRRPDCGRHERRDPARVLAQDSRRGGPRAGSARVPASTTTPARRSGCRSRPPPAGSPRPPRRPRPVRSTGIGSRRQSGKSSKAAIIQLATRITHRANMSRLEQVHHPEDQHEDPARTGRDHQPEDRRGGPSPSSSSSSSGRLAASSALGLAAIGPGLARSGRRLRVRTRRRAEQVPQAQDQGGQQGEEGPETGRRPDLEEEVVRVQDSSLDSGSL